MFSSDKWFGSTPSFYNGVATQSLRFDSANSAYLYRTNSSNSNRKKFTWSGWLKKSVVFTSTGTLNQTYIISGGPSGGDITDSFYFDAQALGLPLNRLSTYWYMGNSSSYGSYVDYSQETDAVFRDVSAWYHIVLAVDTTQSTASNRIKYYVNGTLQTNTTQYYGQVPQDMETAINSNVIQNIGRSIDVGSSSRTFEGYMAEINFIDGFQYDASYFGETKNGVWIAKKYTGSYGTNGYRLEFKNTSVGTGSSSTIGADTSGNNNHWTSSGIAASDCAMPDSPENNFATLNPLDPFSGTLSEGNLKYNNGTSFRASRGNFAIPSSGKWYFEVLNASATSGSSAIFAGVAHADSNISAQPNNGSTTKLYGIYNDSSLGILSNGSQSSSTSNTISADSILQFAIDADNNKFYVGINNSYYTNATTSASFNASNPTESIDLAGYRPFVGAYSNTGILNCGQDASFAGEITAGTATGTGAGVFKYAPPSGYLALCSANLPEPTIGANSSTQSENHFGTLTYTSDGNAVNIVSGGNDNNGTAIGGEINFSPDWVWIKRRNASNNHQVFDTIRGTNVLVPNENGNQSDYSSYFAFLSSSNGFRLPATSVNMNANGGTYVAWNWLAGGGSSVTNNDGSIASTVSANTTAGFSIVKATSPSSGTWTVGHGLGATPTFVIQKYLASSSRWTVWQNHMTSGQYYGLNESNGTRTSGTPFNFTFTDTVIGGNSNYDATSTDVIYYVFHDVEGYCKSGTYTGNNDPDGTFVYLGFRPAFLLYKSTGSGNWLIDDDITQAFNPDSNYLVADTADLEGDTGTNTAGHVFDMLSNGFKLRNNNSARNANETFFYLAFARQAFKYANAR